MKGEEKADPLQNEKDHQQIVDLDPQREGGPDHPEDLTGIAEILEIEVEEEDKNRNHIHRLLYIYM